MTTSTEQLKALAEAIGWKCFHCGEVFTTKLDGLKHFGSSERQDPACTIDVLQYRAMEALVERYVDEDTDLHRSMYKMSSDHETALRREEEAGYARGLADGQRLSVKESCYSPTPARQEDQRKDAEPVDIRAAMKKAFYLGQTYWQQADSEYVSQQNKSDATKAKFDALLEETVINATHPPEVGKLLQQALEAADKFCVKVQTGQARSVETYDDLTLLSKNIRTYLEGKK